MIDTESEPGAWEREMGMRPQYPIQRCGMRDVCERQSAELNALRGRVAELEALLTAICEMQQRNYGHGFDTHIDLSGLCDKARAALAGKDDSCAMYRCTVCGRVGAVGRCCGDETRERLDNPKTVDVDIDEL